MARPRKTRFRRARRVYSRFRTTSRRFYKRKSFIQKNKSILIVALFIGAGYFFKDKISNLFSK